MQPRSYPDNPRRLRFRAAIRSGLTAWVMHRRQAGPGIVLAFPGWFEHGRTDRARVAERQTRWLQVPVSARTWGFKSPLAHHNSDGLSQCDVRLHHTCDVRLHPTWSGPVGPGGVGAGSSYECPHSASRSGDSRLPPPRAASVDTCAPRYRSHRHTGPRQPIVLLVCPTRRRSAQPWRDTPRRTIRSTQTSR